jgi:hypothetical protein
LPLLWLLGSEKGLAWVSRSVPAAQYLPPVFKHLPPRPPQTNISLPVQTAVCEVRPSGALVVLVCVRLSVPGLYFPPVFKSPEAKSDPPQTIISLPVHPAVWSLDRRAEGDNHAREEQRSRAAAKNVSANFAVRFHSCISLVRREPRVAIDPA